MALNTPVHAQPLSSSVVAARDAAERQHKATAAIVAPRIEAHLRAGRIAIETLSAAHQHIGDQTDLDLAGDTRQAAVWIVAGRCLGLSNALIDLLDSGYGVEAMPTAQALHEATRLLDAFTDDGDDSLLTRWLADDDRQWVRLKETRQAREEWHACTSRAGKGGHIPLEGRGSLARHSRTASQGRVIRTYTSTSSSRT